MATQTRRIVSSFLTVGDVGHPSFRVALFKRTLDRPVYPGMWAACSGKIEATDATPLAAAWREVHEETGLDSSKLELSRQGDKIELEDKQLQKMWHIYPFVFKLRTAMADKRPEDLIRLDAEHSEVKFVTLEQAKGMETVENLFENLQKALHSQSP